MHKHLCALVALTLLTFAMFALVWLSVPADTTVTFVDGAQQASSFSSPIDLGMYFR